MPEMITDDDIANMHTTAKVIAPYLPRRDYRKEFWSTIFKVGMVTGMCTTHMAANLADEALVEFDKRFPA